jgi:peptidoglycan/LPS O-acetylase OafA/YrhL
MLLGGMLVTELPDRWLVRALAWIGFHSYSIYLWHLPVMAIGIPWILHTAGLRLSYLQATALYFAVSVIVGVLMAKLIELPVLRLRDAWFSGDAGRRTLERPAVLTPVACDELVRS